MADPRGASKWDAKHSPNDIQDIRYNNIINGALTLTPLVSTNGFCEANDDERRRRRRSSKNLEHPWLTSERLLIQFLFFSRTPNTKSKFHLASRHSTVRSSTESWGKCFPIHRNSTSLRHETTGAITSHKNLDWNNESGAAKGILASVIFKRIS